MSVADDNVTFTQEDVDRMIAEQVDGLKKNRDEALQEAKRAKAALKNYDGVDPQEFKTLKQQAEEAAQKKAAAEGDFNALKKQLVENHQKELADRDTKISKTQKALEKRLVQAELTAAIAAKKGVPELLLPYATQFVKVRETEDDYEAYIADEKGNQLFSDGSATPMTFDSFVEQKLMVKFPRAFDGTGSSGGGASKSTAGSGGARVVAAGDSRAFIANLADIASGKVEVAQ